MPKPVHILAKRSDIAPLVVTVGDPARAEQLAAMLKDSKVVNTNQGFITYTGRYNGERVTVSTHGVGGPSSAIAFEELCMLGARSIVRLGTAGGMVDALGIGDFVIPTGAAYQGGAPSAYIPDGVLPPVPDIGLTAKLIEGCKTEGVNFMSGIVLSTDAFYNESPRLTNEWALRGVIGVEMECATLFTLGIIRRFRAASILIVSDSLARKISGVMVTADKLKVQVEMAGKIVFKALTE